ncbi:NAD-dependent succinate-semialdehyde dehydrogenase [Inmirania thermothiophila]|uniref:Succinate-semialdehyde dehydrogenase/glutarate-semialdehyde dehydrogenase n=1 Tax=Inmirania thermothiophila TaxID=1750597 RepID=A0A3N1Y8Q0_9GAMM|nr:NAD-dependent succinate-semialdehyde dehydrogenase [Inmirania thermothiophila]ROR35186.1 succinate-semialdehyde dehydrogenase/glutarate-semialdehyde dehydrogenase [Inmirania thermothiophila]
MYIAGEWCEAASGRRFPSHDPATGERLGEVPNGDAQDAERAVAAAAEAFPAWRETSAYERAALLQRAHAGMLARAEAIARLMSREQGKPLKAALAEVRYAADFLAWYAEEAKRVYGRTIPSARRDQRFLLLRQPVGVVAAITPWNYPVSMLTRKLGPALAAGCTAVLKPAEQTPLCARAVFEVLHEAGLPPGVANLVTTADPAPVGEVLTADPRVAKITFTGSTEVGRRLAERAARHLKRISMELGGHAPALVFADADPVHAAKGLAALKFLNAGQACISPNRIYVQRPLYGTFLETFAARAARIRVGHGLEEGVGMGPLVDAAALAKVERQVADAVGKGARLVCGGHRPEGLEGGFFYAPTVLADVTPEMTVYREETFGPVAPVIPFDDPAEAVALANDTDYGLAAYVYTRDLARAWRTVEGLDFGIIGVNDVNPTAAAAPFGGMKDSGLGREGGPEGIEEYLEVKVAGISL